MRDPWKANLHAFFLDWMSAYKQGIKALLQFRENPPIVKAIGDKLRGELQRSVQKHPDVLQVRYSSLNDMSSIYPPSDAVNHLPRQHQNALDLMSWFHWRRFSTSFYQDYEKSLGRDYEAYGRVERTMCDSTKLYCGSSPIKPPKGNLEHACILEMGLAFGLDKLTAEELAKFFNEYCPCGKDDHDPDTLRKQRAALLEKIRLLNLPDAPIPSNLHAR